MADILSQEEIDRLLNAASGPAPAEAASISEDTVARVASVAGHLMAAANASLGTLIARQASVSHGMGESVPTSDFDAKPHMLVRAPFRSGFSGELCFVMETGPATQLADLVLGGDGAAKDTPEEADADALKEAFGQVTGNAAPAITGAVSVEVGFSTPSVSFVASGQMTSKLASGQVVAIRGQLKVEDILSTPLWVLCAADTAEKIASALAASAPAFAPDVAEPAPRAAPSYTAPQAAQASYAAPPQDVRNIDLILDIEVEVMVRLGNAEMPLRDIQRLRPGSIIDLDRDTEALVELVVNDRVIAKGELVVVSSDHFALRVTEILTPTERIRSLGGH